MTAELIREHLASIDLSKVEDEKEMSEQDRRDYCAAIHAVFPRLEKDMKKFLYQQLLQTSKESETWDQVLFGRGVFDGIAQLLAYWNQASQEHVANSTVENEFNKHAPMGEI